MQPQLTRTSTGTEVSLSSYWAFFFLSTRNHSWSICIRGYLLINLLIQKTLEAKRWVSAHHHHCLQVFLTSPLECEELAKSCDETGSLRAGKDDSALYTTTHPNLLSINQYKGKDLVTSHQAPPFKVPAPFLSAKVLNGMPCPNRGNTYSIYRYKHVYPPSKACKHIS